MSLYRVLGESDLRQPVPVKLDLEPLSHEYSTRLARTILGSVASPELEKTVVSESRGYPLYIVEMARALLENPNYQIPSTLHRVIESQLDALDNELKQIILVASCYRE